jgi:hypothetical protein
VQQVRKRGYMSGLMDKMKNLMKNDEYEVAFQDTRNPNMYNTNMYGTNANMNATKGGDDTVNKSQQYIKEHKDVEENYTLLNSMIDNIETEKKPSYTSDSLSSTPVVDTATSQEFFFERANKVELLNEKLSSDILGQMQQKMDYQTVEKTVEIVKLKNENAWLYNLLKNSEINAKTYLLEKQSLAIEMRQLELTLKSKENHIAFSEEKLVAMSQKEVEINLEKDQLAQECSDLKEINSELERKIKNVLSKQIDELITRNDELADKTNKIAEHNDALKNEISELIHANKSLSLKVRELEYDKKALNIELQNIHLNQMERDMFSK